MPFQVRELPPLINSSGSSPVTAGISAIDDAYNIILYLSTNTNVLASGVSVEVSNRAMAGDIPPFVTSTDWYPIQVGTSVFLSSGVQAFTLTNIGYRSLRLRTSTNTLTTGTTIAFATKQILV